MEETDAFQSSQQIKITICLAAHGKQNPAAPSKAEAEEQQQDGLEGLRPLSAEILLLSLVAKGHTPEA